MGRFALCIPDGSDGTRALPPCSDRRWQVAGTAGQPYLVFRSLAFLLGMGQPPGGRRRSPTTGAPPDGRCGPAWVRGALGRDPWAGRIWQCGEFVYEPRKLEPGCWFTSRNLGIEAMDDRLLHHCIHTDADVAGPAPGEPRVGRGDSWAKPAAIVRPFSA